MQLRPKPSENFQQSTCSACSAFVGPVTAISRMHNIPTNELLVGQTWLLFAYAANASLAMKLPGTLQTARVFRLHPILRVEEGPEHP